MHDATDDVKGCGRLVDSNLRDAPGEPGSARYTEGRAHGLKDYGQTHGTGRLRPLVRIIEDTG